MSDSTKMPALNYFQWSTVAAPNPKLNSPIDADDTTLIFTSAPLDEDGNVVTGHFLMGIKNSDSYVETVYVPAGGMSVDGLTATGCIRGVEPTGLDYNTSNASFASSFDQDSPVLCNITATMASIMRNVLQGTGDMATGGLSFVLGDETDSTVTIKRAKSGSVEGFLRLNNTTGKVQFQNSPAGTWVNIDDVAASNLVQVSAADTTPSYLNDKILAGDGLDQAIGTPAGNETVNLAVDVTDIIDTSFGLTEDTNNIRVNLDTDPGVEFNAGALRVKVKAAGGITRDGDGLSLTDIVFPSTTGVAHESIAQGDAICELPMEVEYYTGLTDADLNLGDSNTRRKYAVSLVPKEAFTGSAPFNRIRGKKIGTGLNLTVRIETDSSGEPSGTLVDANATATVTAASFATSHTDETVTWGGSFTLAKGTQYWIVLQVASTDAANYLSLSVNSSHDENYLTFGRQTFNLDSGTWGSSVTNACPWFWNVTAPQLGFGLVPCDASFGRRTWNFVGVADAAYSANTDVTYYHDLVPVETLGLTLALKKKNVYISTSPGVFTSTVGVYDFDDEANRTYNFRIGHTSTDKDGSTLLKINLGPKKMFMFVQSSVVDESHVIQTWFSDPMVKIAVANLDTGSAMGTGIGFGSASTEMAGTREGVVFAEDTIYGATTGDNIRISSVTDATVTIIVDETAAADIKAVIELEQI